jgi:peptide/nickel transport system ATP-binding protein
MDVLTVSDLHVDIATRTSVVHAVDGVSFGLGQGETLGLVGESGCGKTTTGLGLLRLLPAGAEVRAERVVLDGRDLATLGDAALRGVRGRDIGVVFQDPMTSLNPTMTVGDQVGEPLRIHRRASARAARARAVELLGLVGLPSPKEQVHKYPHELSGGMRQRVGIAAALACDPKVLIADEPTTALDVTTQDQILELFGQLRTALGMAVLLITHDLGVVAGQADRVMVMYAGQIVESGPTDAIYARTRHRYTEALLASIPRLDTSRATRLYSIPGLPPDLSAPPPACRFAPRCRFATEECRTDAPPVVEDAEGHAYACFHPVENGRPAA